MLASAFDNRLRLKCVDDRANEIALVASDRYRSRFCQS